jgi:schlafen family protein
MSQQSLESRVADLEDSFIERKEGLHSNDEIRKTVVSFANSLLEGQTAVLFVGVANDGTVVGVSAGDAEKIQQRVRRVCEEDCFPAVAILVADVLTVDGKHAVAFEFGPSSNRPHFAGHAYLRIGAETVKASAPKLDELIASKNSKAGRLLAAKDRHEFVTVVIPDRALIPGLLPFSQRREWQCKVESCDAHVVVFDNVSAGRTFTLPLEHLLFGKDPNQDRLLVEYTRVR